MAAALVVRQAGQNAVISRDEFTPLLEFEYELPLDLFSPDVHQVVVDIANRRLSVIEADLRIFTPVDTGALLRSLFVKEASVFDPSIGAGYTEEYGVFVEFGNEHFDGYHFFTRLVGAHIARLQSELFALARELQFIGGGFEFFGI